MLRLESARDSASIDIKIGRFWATSIFFVISYQITVKNERKIEFAQNRQILISIDAESRADSNGSAGIDE